MTAQSTMILGAAVGLQIADVRLFVESLRRHYQGEAILLIRSGNLPLVDYLRSRRVIPVFFDSAYWMVCHVQLSRFFRYGELLRPASRPYDRILLTDVSDVVFQADPFAGLPTGDLLCFMEEAGRTIGVDPMNSQWVREVLGQESLDRIADRPISCSGTTIGTHRAILDYIDRLAAHANPEILLQHRQRRGHDQGIHNYLLHTGALRDAQMIANGRHVLTMGAMSEKTIGLGEGGTILTHDRHVCPIVHQYNYHARAVEHVRGAYPQPD
jgi:hypothetical protein